MDFIWYIVGYAVVAILIQILLQYLGAVFAFRKVKKWISDGKIWDQLHDFLKRDGDKLLETVGPPLVALIVENIKMNMLSRLGVEAKADKKLKKKASKDFMQMISPVGSQILEQMGIEIDNPYLAQLAGPYLRQFETKGLQHLEGMMGAMEEMQQPPVDNSPGTQG